MEDKSVKPGYYRHFKGEVYKVIGMCMHTETEEVLVLYEHKTESNPYGVWARPVDMFNDYKELPDGSKVKRFEWVGETNPNL